VEAYWVNENIFSPLSILKEKSGPEVCISLTFDFELIDVAIVSLTPTHALVLSYTKFT